MKLKLSSEHANNNYTYADDDDKNNNKFLSVTQSSVTQASKALCQNVKTREASLPKKSIIQSYQI